MNAVYEEGEAPAKKTGPVSVFGFRIPAESRNQVVLALFGVLLILVVIVVFLLPSGLPFLAAKNSTGFLGYVGLFFAYMFGFFAILVIFFSLLGLLGVSFNRQFNKLE